MAREYNLTYYPWITQHVLPEVIRQNIELFATTLGEELHRQMGGAVTVSVSNVMEVPQQIESLAGGESQIALMNPLGFVFARRRNPSIEAAAVALRIIDGKLGDSYFAQIYTHLDTGVKTLNEARKRSIGFGSPQSTSNFLIPARDLLEAGIHPLTGFSRVEFTGGHEKAAMAVYQKKVELGAGHDGAIIDLAKQPGYGDAEKKLVMLYRSDPIPSDPIGVNVGDKEEYMAIQKALVAVSMKSPAKEAIAVFWGNAQGLQETTASAYDNLLAAVTDLALKEKDLFG